MTQYKQGYKMLVSYKQALSLTKTVKRFLENDLRRLHVIDKQAYEYNQEHFTYSKWISNKI